MCNKPAPAPPHHNPPIKQLQPTQILANKNTNRATEQEEHEQEHQESEPYQHQEPEPEQESEALKINIPSKEPETFAFNIPAKFLCTNGTYDRNKASAFFEGVGPNTIKKSDDFHEILIFHSRKLHFSAAKLIPRGEVTATTLKERLEQIANGDFAII